MGKESRQGIVLLVVILAAVVLIDMGNSQLSGRLVDRRNVVAGDEADSYIEQITETPTIAQSSSSTTSITAQPGKKHISCSKFSEQTPHVQAKFPNDYIDSIRPLDDAQMRYLIINLQDMNSGRRRWVFYDIGPDGKFSADDQVQSRNSMGGSWFEGQIGIKSDNNEKLFWITFQSTMNAVMSCTLPQCADETTEFTVSGVFNIEKISPSLLNNRMALILSDQTFNIETLYSCSLNPNDNDACNKPETQYKTHATNIAGMISVRDGSIAYVDIKDKNAYLFSSNPGSAEKIISLPQGTDMFMMKRVAPGIPSMFIIKYLNKQNINITELLILNLLTGAISQPIDSIMNNVYLVHLIGMKGRVYTIYEVENPYPSIFKKEIGQEEKEILIGYQNWARDMKELPSGTVIGSAARKRIVSFDCTP